jgi:hypothetical protein
MELTTDIGREVPPILGDIHAEDGIGEEPRRRRGRGRLRVLQALWLPATLLLDGLQFLVFPGNSEPLMSLFFGLFTFGAALALPIALVENWTYPSRSLPTKVILSLLTILGLSAIVYLAGLAMLFTHICM